MKKKTIYAFLIAALLVSGCSNNQTVTAETTSATTEETTTTTAKETETTTTTAETEATATEVTEELTVEEIINRCGRVKGWYTYNYGDIRQGYGITLNWGEDTTATVSGDIITADIRNSRNTYQASACSALYTDPETPNIIVDPFDGGVPLSSFLTEYRNWSDNSRNPYQIQLSDVVLHIKNIDSIEKHGRQGELIEKIDDYTKIVPDDTGETYYYVELTADSSEQSYYTEKDISVNAFIRKNGGKAELLIDIKTPRLIQFNYSSAEFAA